jgi:hypothetical protein
MNLSQEPTKLVLVLLVMFIFVCMPSIDGRVWGMPTNDSPTSIISSLGQPLPSVFDGLKTNEQTRARLLSTVRVAPHAPSLDLKSSSVQNMLGIKPLLNAFAVASCTTGICAQPGTASAPGEFCEDSTGCATDVSNQQIRKTLPLVLKSFMSARNAVLTGSLARFPHQLRLHPNQGSPVTTIQRRLEVEAISPMSLVVVARSS